MKKNYKYIAITFLLFSCLIFITGCCESGRNDGNKTSYIANNDSTAGEVVNDSEITAKIKAEYLKDEDIKSLRIHVSTRKGVVTLRGNVPSDDMAKHAIEIAKQINGVYDVVSKLKVMEPSHK